MLGLSDTGSPPSGFLGPVNSFSPPLLSFPGAKRRDGDARDGGRSEFVVCCSLSPCKWPSLLSGTRRAHTGASLKLFWS